MSLFEVPGWSVPSSPATRATPSTSKKRKRPSHNDHDKVQASEPKFEQIIQQVGSLRAGDISVTKGTEHKRKSTGGKGRRREQKPRDRREGQAEPDSFRNNDAARSDHGRKHGAMAKNPHGTEQEERDGPNEKRNKKRKKTEPKKAQSPLPTALHKATTGEPHSSSDQPSKLTALQAQMKNSLEGARFRWINETLYKSDSEHAHQMIREEPNVFEEYHTGFRHQVQSWPTNPVSQYISELSTYTPRTVIADLGCGDAALARALIPKRMTVLSFDLKSDGMYVIECDICAHLPLPGSDPLGGADDAEGEGNVVDIVVCALSLMGTNWPSCIREAWRVLKPSGELKIAEVASRFTDMEAFVSLICSVGFKLKSKDDSNTHFTLLDFEKVGRKTPVSQKQWTKILGRGDLLKPCEYKRR